MESNPPPPSPSNPFTTGGDDENQGDDGGEQFYDAFALSPVAAKSSPMPSLQSIQQQEQMQMQHQAAASMSQSPHQHQQTQQLKFDSLPSPEELAGPMNDTSWPPPPSNNFNTPSMNNNTINNNNNNAANSNQNQSFLSKLLTCGGICSIEVLRPYFDIDTADIFVRMKGSLQYCMVMDGFRNEVLYSDNAFRLAYRDTNTSSSEGAGEAASNTIQNNSSTSSTTPSSSGKGPDLYGPVWITLTLVFFVAVTSNMSLYIHHHKTNKSVIDEGGIAAEVEWDYDINQLLHAMWILYSFSIGLPTLFYFVLRLVGVNNLSLPDLVCFYGYSLVPYLPVAWLCIVPYSWVQWLVLGVATVLSGMLVLRNVVGSILESSSNGSGGVSGLQGKSGGLIMFLVGCHFVFFLVMKLAFYHHHD